MQDRVIYKYLSGTATSEEEKCLLDWLNASSANRAAFFELKAIWHAKQQAVFANEDRLNAALEQMNLRISSGVDRKKRKRNLFIRWSSVAAVIFLLIGLSFFYLTHINVADREIPLCVFSNEASGDSVRKVVLTDGTEVWLAAHTTLSCPEIFAGSERKVILEGIAFFDVAKDSIHPFVVHTDVAEIKVLGTSFSVNSRMSDDLGETILMSGSVVLKHLKNNRELKLSPGQQAIYSKVSSEIEVNEVDVNTLTSWRYGIISMTGVSVSEIIQKLEAIYQMKIKMDFSAFKDNKYNFSFKRSNDLEKVLEQLTCVTGGKAEIARK